MLTDVSCWRVDVVGLYNPQSKLLSLSFGLRSFVRRTDAKDMNMKMSVIILVSLV